jgi:hypothetical protein
MNKPNNNKRKLMSEQQQPGEHYTSEEEHVTVEAIPPQDRSGYHIYLIWSAYAKEAEPFAVQGLLQIADFVQANRSRLEQEAREDDERNARAWDADMRDLEQIKREWRSYRLAGDETPPSSLH